MENISRVKHKFIRSLKLKKNRIKNRQFLIEGSKLLQEALKSFPSHIQTILTTDKTFRVNHNIPVFHCSKLEMDQISQLSNSTDFIAIMSFDFVEKIKFGNKLIIIDGIQDPGNLGTIIRTCDWFGVQRIICSFETVDHFNPKVIQASMGSIFRVKVDYLNLEEFIQKSNLKIFSTTMNGQSFEELNWSNIDALVIGNEGNGVSPKLISKLPQVCIPGNNQVESLNVAVATGIFLSKWYKD